MFGLSLNETLTLAVAAYAAVISTFVLGWDAYKWLNEGPSVRISASTGMVRVGGAVPDPNTYVSVTAVNVGDRATTITNLGFLYYRSWWRAYMRRKRSDAAFIVTQPAPAQPLPYRFEAGAQWIGLCDQSAETDRMIREGYLFVVLYCSTAGRGIRHRLRRREHAAVEKHQVPSVGEGTDVER
ncbi:hypothetical protein [Burkholderia cenocepacia]|uniref:hypothetical protein n=2 Tax=Burkholderia cepacia complex TaxID=87882 RepID=UPI00285C331C|nr:hypothetical protein [Burkholderia cenocepacia]MDR8049593.1 hypothetical protein [Burkholderia cenocepacia]